MMYVTYVSYDVYYCCVSTITILVYLNPTLHEDTLEARFVKGKATASVLQVEGKLQEMSEEMAKDDTII